MILAAGRGERMGSLTLKTPKSLAQVQGTSLIERNLTLISRVGITDIVINVHWLGDQIINFLGNGDRFGLRITYMEEQQELLGTGGGIFNALSYLGEEPFWLINSDVFSNYEINIKKTLANHAVGHLILVPNPKHNSTGDFYLEKNIVKFKEGNQPYTYSGISLLSAKLFQECVEKIFPLEPILEKAALSETLTGEIFNGLWMDVGTQERLNELEKIIS